ncbi:MAG TPA: hypothetical protein VGM90_24740 [Kofleriaceae bacterium]|jgi:hypothetical protein
MAIDYVLATGCQPQKQLGVERLVELHRTRVLARSMLLHMQEDGVSKQPKDIAVQLTMRAPGGDSARGVTLQDLLDEAKPLDDVSHFCHDECPAQLRHEFGCHRRIRYPIPEHVEQWLMARLPTSLACTAGALLVRGLGEFNWDGSPVAKLRAAGDTFFESRVAYGVRWDGESGPFEISSDQIFQMMFMVGPLAPTHSMMLALFLGVIPHDIELAALKDTDGRTRALAKSYVAPEADPDIEQIAAFLRTLAAAAQLEVPILIDG